MESDSDTVISGDIYDRFLDELVLSNNENVSYNEFLDYKELGLVYLYGSKYRIIDKKKWMLAKIKYGL